MEQVLALTESAFDHDYRVAARTRTLMLASFVLYSLAVAMLLFLTALSYGLVPLIVVCGMTLLGYYLLARWAAARLRYLPESLRPRFTR